MLPHLLELALELLADEALLVVDALEDRRLDAHHVLGCKIAGAADLGQVCVVGTDLRLKLDDRVLQVPDGLAVGLMLLLQVLEAAKVGV